MTFWRWLFFLIKVGVVALAAVWAARRRISGGSSSRLLASRAWRRASTASPAATAAMPWLRAR